MDKQAADSLITEYTKKIFGFALGKTASVDEAEELAARITLDVYVSLRGAGEIANVPGYVYRVASNVYARYVDELARGRTVSLNSLDLSDARLADTRRFEQQILDGAEAAALRREVSRLGRMQREIIVLHYFERLTVSEIARRLGIPDGTVKWHLSDARKSLKARIELKEGINMTREIGKLGMNPVSFSDMGHSGKPGKFGDTAHFLVRRLTQNIVYAAYYEPRTVTEIADELGVSAAFVEDEAKLLEQYGFLDSLKGGKLRANVIIDDLPPEYYEAEHKLLLKYAEIVKKQYVPGVIEALDALPRGTVWVPDGDRNLLLWSGISFALFHALPKDRENKREDISSQYNVKRPDGGEYVAFAKVKRSPLNLSFDPRQYAVCGSMWRYAETVPAYMWQINTMAGSRKITWMEFDDSDVIGVYEAMSGALIKSDKTVERISKLEDRGFLDSDGKPNVVVVKIAPFELDESMLQTETPAALNLPAPSAELTELGFELAKEDAAMLEQYYPEHIRPYFRQSAYTSFGRTGLNARVLQMLAEDGTLTVPREDRRRGMQTLMFADRLPE